MEADALPDMQWQRLAELIAARTGLSFPPARRPDLLRALEAAARETDFQEPARYAEWLLSARPTARQLHALACHLTVGETYFFREGRTLDALSRHVLPELIERRRGGDRHLRLWSAACSTGEEAYSLAMLLDRLLPEQKGWRVTILATDINERALAKAAAGVYGEWSFRAFPEELRERYFTRTADGRFGIRADIRERVTFAQLNLAADEFASWAVDTRAMDVVLCRNVLIYFAAEQARQLVRRLHESLAEGGWLAVSPSECSQALFSRFSVVNFPDAILYRKRNRTETVAHDVEGGALTHAGVRADIPEHRPSVSALPPNRDVKRAQAPSTAEPVTHSTPNFATLARESANRGHLTQALALSEQWIAADKVDPAAHYLHATVLQEIGNREAARRAFHRCLYLQPDFALAHFALGTLERSEAHPAEARRHFENAQRLLHARPAEELLPESEGLTVGHLAAIVATLLDVPAPAAPSPPTSTPLAPSLPKSSSAPSPPRVPARLAPSSTPPESLHDTHGRR